jgi:hypothetical protein
MFSAVFFIKYITKNNKYDKSFRSIIKECTKYLYEEKKLLVYINYQDFNVKTNLYGGILFLLISS